MKKISQLLIVVCFVLLNVQLVSAAEAWSDVNYDFSKVHKILIAEPNYSPVTGGSTAEEVKNVMYLQAQYLNMQPVTTAEVDKNILRDSSTDLAKLRVEDSKKAESIFNNEMGKYTDLYMVATIVHNTRVMIFYDVYSAQTKQPVFTYQIVASSTDEDNLMTYKQLTKSFYKEFNKAVSKSIKGKK